MSTLERHCRLLLLAYPAAYRRERGEEMLGTLLETTPAGRAWPSPRDSVALLAGGIRAHAARNQDATTVASLRVAALFGVAIYLGLYVNTVGYGYVNTVGYGLFFHRWSEIAAAVLISATILAVWFAPRTIVSIAALAAGAAYYISAAGSLRSMVLPALAALALLAGGQYRPRPLWLWLPAFAIAAPALDLLSLRVFHLYTGVFSVQGFQLYWIIAMLVGVVAWLAADPRPAFALAIYFGLWLADRLILFMTVRLPAGPRIPGRAQIIFGSFAWECLAAAVVLTMLALWRMRRRTVL